MAGFFTDNCTMRKFQSPSLKTRVCLLVLSSTLVTFTLIWNAVPFALIPTLFWLSTLAIPGSIPLGFLLAKHSHYSRYAPLSVLVATLGIGGVMFGFIWDLSLETLQKAAHYGSTQWLTTQLNRSRLGPDVVDTHGSSLLMIAAQHGNTEVMKQLLRMGARTGYRDGDGDTALSVAIRYKHTECIKLLRDAGARW